jgi:hypothetical protein
MKKVGIVVDDYKLDKYKKDLIKKGYTDINVKPFVNNTSVIQVRVLDNQVPDVHKICQLADLYFKRGN